MAAFYVALICGIVVGIALVFLHRLSSLQRLKQRSQKAVDIALLSRLDINTLRAICKEDMPSWCSFPEYERVRWVNTELKEVWPFINKAVSSVVKASMEPLLENYRPIGVTSLKLDTFSLGQMAPQVSGVRIQKVKEQQVQLDVELKWGGDPSIILACRAGPIQLPVQLKDLTIFTTARVILELSEELPCVAAVVVSLLAKPKPVIKYTLKAVGGSLTAVPGLVDIINEVVTNAVSDTLVWPRRIVTPLVVGYDTSHLELRIEGRLTVTVVRARGLKNVDLVGKSDPYVILYTRPLFKLVTRIIDDDLDPVWEETFEVEVEEKNSAVLHLKVKDEGMLQDAPLGQTYYDVSTLPPDQPVEAVLFLMRDSEEGKHMYNKNAGLGTLTIRMQYHDYTKAEQEVVMQAEKELMTAAKKSGKGFPAAVGGAAQALHAGAMGVGGAVAHGLGAGLSAVGEGVSASARRGLAGLGSLSFTKT